MSAASRSPKPRIKSPTARPQTDRIADLRLILAARGRAPRGAAPLNLLKRPVAAEPRLVRPAARRAALGGPRRFSWAVVGVLAHRSRRLECEDLAGELVVDAAPTPRAAPVALSRVRLSLEWAARGDAEGPGRFALRPLGGMPSDA